MNAVATKETRTPSEGAEVVGVRQPAEEEEGRVDHPAKVFRIGMVIGHLLDEAHRIELDEESRVRMWEIYKDAVRELNSLMSADLRKEFSALRPELVEGVPSVSELRTLYAQLWGWIEGLFHGIQAALFEQFMESRKQLEELRKRGLEPTQRAARDGPYL
jgi:Protein of unknown function (DUF2587)